ncbi:hypothetical protein D3C83_326070 [compost metagenome]
MARLASVARSCFIIAKVRCATRRTITTKLSFVTIHSQCHFANEATNRSACS